MIAWIVFLAVSILYGAFYAARCFHKAMPGQACAVLALLLLPMGCTYALITHLIR